MSDFSRAVGHFRKSLLAPQPSRMATMMVTRRISRMEKRRPDMLDSLLFPHLLRPFSPPPQSIAGGAEDGEGGEEIADNAYAGSGKDRVELFRPPSSR